MNTLSNYIVYSPMNTLSNHHLIFSPMNTFSNHHLIFSPMNTFSNHHLIFSPMNTFSNHHLIFSPMNTHNHASSFRHPHISYMDTPDMYGMYKYAFLTIMFTHLLASICCVRVL